VAEQAGKADALIDDLQAAGLPEVGPVLQGKLIRLELLKVKGDLERELGQWLLDCQRCRRTAPMCSCTTARSRARGTRA
jgi:hypothetical protein